jgi:NitT/TauT family transport system substrate-binding protein
MAPMMRIAMVGALAAAAVAWLTVPVLAADKVRVHVQTPSIEALPYRMADVLGYYRADGIDFDGEVLNTDVGVRAMVSGELDASQILGLSLRGAIDHGADLKIVMLFDDRPTYSLYVAKTIHSYDDLKGREIATSTSGASATRVLVAALKEHGLEPDKDVPLIYVGGTAPALQALLSGTVSGAVLLTPQDFLAKDRGYPSLPFADTDAILSGGVSANGRFLRERTDVARRFLHATWRALRTMKTDRATTVAAMAPYMKIDAALAGRIYDTWIDRMSDTGTADAAHIDRILAFEFGHPSAEMAQRAFDFSIVSSFNQAH